MTQKSFRDASGDILVGGEKYRAALKLGQLIALEDTRDAGPIVLLDRIVNDYWRTEDLRQTIRFGLMGGGMDDTAALRLVDTFVVPGRLDQYIKTAGDLLTWALSGSPEDPIKGEPEAPTNESPTIEG